MQRKTIVVEALISDNCSEEELVSKLNKLFDNDTDVNTKILILENIQICNEAVYSERLEMYNNIIDNSAGDNKKNTLMLKEMADNLDSMSYKINKYLDGMK